MNDDLPFIYPADLGKAERHRLATRIFKGVSPDEGSQDRCQCCQRRVGELQGSKECCYSPIYDLDFLGPGVPLLFVFIQNALLALVLLTILFFFYAIVTNLLGNSCELNSNCIMDIFNELSLSNKINDNQSLMIQTYLVAAFILIYIVFSQYMIFRVRLRNQKCDELIDSPSDYSIIIKNLPDQVTEMQIANMLNKHRSDLDFDMKEATKNLKVRKIIVTYALEKYLKDKKKQEKQFLKAKKKDQNAHFERAPIAKPTQTASFAIIVFDTQFAKETFFVEQQLLHCCKKQVLFEVNQHPVIIERAPEPDDILWENADVPKWKRRRNMLLTYFFGMLILLGGGIVQYYLQYFQKRIDDAQIRSYFSTATSLLLTVFNGILLQFLIIMTRLEGNQTKTDLDRSLLVKTCIYSFFNAGIFYSVANILAQSVSSFNFQGNFSFEITLFMTMNAITPNIISLIITKLEFPTVILRFFVRMGCCKYTQAEANKLFQMEQVDFPVKYSYVIRTLWLTCFYAPFVPIVVPISMGGLIFFYFTQTELFRSSYRAPNMLSMNITRTAIRLMDFTGVALSCGQILIVFYIKYLFNSKFTLPEQIGVFLCVGLSALLIFLPSLKINKKFFPISDNSPAQPDYDEALKEFQVTYQGTNPLSDPSQRVRKNDLNLFKFMNIFDILQMRKSRSPSATGPSPNPFATMLSQPNRYPGNQLEVPRQFNQAQLNQYNQYNQANQANQFQSTHFNPFNHLNNHLL